MYEKFADEYDHFVNWHSRLAFEMPFITTQLKSIEAQKGQPLAILDAACGSGMHAIALAELGYKVSGADLYPEMIGKAQSNATQARQDVHFQSAGFGQLSHAFGSGKFNALLCLGNSLPHATSELALSETLADFHNCLKEGSLLLIQNRNFDQVLAKKERWMEPQATNENGMEWVFLRFYDFEADGLISFNILTLKREQGAMWQTNLTSTFLKPLTKDYLDTQLTQAGFKDIVAYGNMDGSEFNPETSPNLILTARK